MVPSKPLAEDGTASYSRNGDGLSVVKRIQRGPLFCHRDALPYVVEIVLQFMGRQPRQVDQHVAYVKLHIPIVARGAGDQIHRIKSRGRIETFS